MLIHPCHEKIDKRVMDDVDGIGDLAEKIANAGRNVFFHFATGAEVNDKWKCENDR